MEPGVLAYLDGSPHPRDAETMIELMRHDAGEHPHVGYQPESATRGDTATAYVVDEVRPHAELLEQLGPHTTGVGCIYMKDMVTVDLEVLEAIVSRPYAALTRTRRGPRRREE